MQHYLRMNWEKLLDFDNVVNVENSKTEGSVMRGDNMQRMGDNGRIQGYIGISCLGNIWTRTRC